MKQILLILLILPSFCFAQRKLLRENVAGNPYVNEAVSGIFNYVISETNLGGYTEAYLQGDETSKIMCFNRWGGQALDLNSNFYPTPEVIRTEIRYLYDSIGFNNLTSEEKAACATWFVLSESERESLYTAEELLMLAINFYDILFETNLRVSDTKRNQIDFKSLGYFEKKFYNTFGDIVKVEYYHRYTTATNAFYDLRVTESFEILRDTVYGLPYLETKTTTWFMDGVELPDPLVTSRNFSTLNAYEFNKRASSRLIDESALFLLGAIGLMDAQTFLNGSVPEMIAYVSGSRQPLLDKISSYTFSASSQLNTYIKSTLSAKLNIHFVN